jgi:excisionase family DNA binding protein/PAS domain S-box-containing protein
MENREKRLLTVKELAHYLQVNQTTIYRLVRRSEVPAFKVGGNWRFNIESIDAWRLSVGARSPTVPVPSDPRLPRNLANLPAALLRLSQTLSEMIAPIADLQAMLPIIKRIAQALEDRRDASGEIAKLYEGKEIAFRNHSENLLKFVPTPFATADADRRLVSYNDAYCRLFGFRRNQLRNMRLRDLVHLEDLDRFMALNERLWRKESEVGSIVGRRLTSAGKPIPIRSTAWPVRFGPGAEPEYLAAALERIADRKEATALFTRSAERLSDRRESLLRRS